MKGVEHVGKTQQACRNRVRPLPPCTIALEACGNVHSWARRFREFGYAKANRTAIRQALRKVEQERCARRENGLSSRLRAELHLLAEALRHLGEGCELSADGKCPASIR